MGTQIGMDIVLSAKPALTHFEQFNTEGFMSQTLNKNRGFVVDYPKNKAAKKILTALCKFKPIEFPQSMRLSDKVKSPYNVNRMEDSPEIGKISEAITNLDKIMKKINMRMKFYGELTQILNEENLETALGNKQSSEAKALERIKKKLAKKHKKNDRNKALIADIDKLLKKDFAGTKERILALMK